MTSRGTSYDVVVIAAASYDVRRAPDNDARRPPAQCRGPSSQINRSVLLVGPEVEVVQRHGLVAGAEVVVSVAVVASHGVRRSAGFLGGLHPDVAVPLEA